VVSLPLATTTVTIRRPEGGDDPYEADRGSLVVRGRRAHIGSPHGSETIVGGSKEVVDAVLRLDPSPCLTHRDLVTDDGTGECWSVVWVRQRQGLGLDHQAVGLRAVKGGADG